MRKRHKVSISKGGKRSSLINRGLKLLRSYWIPGKGVMVTVTHASVEIGKFEPFKTKRLTLMEVFENRGC